MSRLLGSKEPKNFIAQTPTVLDTQNLTDSVDWRSQGVVNPVKNQGQCGSCWSFAAATAMESAHAIKTKELLSLSEQQFVDCDTTCEGCNGGYAYYAFRYAQKHKIALEQDYTYTAKDGACQEDKFAGHVGVQNYKTVTPRSKD